MKLQRPYSEISVSSEEDQRLSPRPHSHEHIPRHLPMTNSPPQNDSTLSSGSDTDSDISDLYEESRSRDQRSSGRTSAGRDRRTTQPGDAETIDLTNEPDSPLPPFRPPNSTQYRPQPGNMALEVMDLDSEPDRSRQDRLRRRPLQNDGNSSGDNILFSGSDQDLEVLGERQIRDRRLPTPVQTRLEDPGNPLPPDPFLRRPSAAANSSRAQQSTAHRGYFEGALRGVFGFMGFETRDREGSRVALRGGPISIPEPASDSLNSSIRRGLPTELRATLGPPIHHPRQPRHVPANIDNLPWPNLDYEAQGFQMATPRPPSPPRRAPPEYHPPAKPRPGYTRKVQEEQILVCPRCEDELGTGDDPVKSQVWASKCGHVNISSPALIPLC